jgi:hypothetical protein
MSDLRLDICQTPVLSFIYKVKQKKGVKMTHLTQEMRDKNTHEYFKAFAVAQQERNRLRHEAIVSASPWLQQAREIQKALNAKEVK